MPPRTSMSVLEGSTINAVSGDTVNNFGNAQNVNRGRNYSACLNHLSINYFWLWIGTINQQDFSGGPGIPPWLHDMHTQMQRDYYQRGGGEGSRPPIHIAHYSPPAGLPYQHQPHNYGYPHQLPSPTYPPRGLPPGYPQYQSSPHYAAPREERSHDDLYEDDSEDEGLLPYGPVPSSAAYHPGARPIWRLQRLPQLRPRTLARLKASLPLPGNRTSLLGFLYLGPEITIDDDLLSFDCCVFVYALLPCKFVFTSTRE